MTDLEGRGIPTVFVASKEFVDAASTQAAALDLPKFRDGGLLIAHAGGGAGLFSAIIGGWASGAVGSETTTWEIRP